MGFELDQTYRAEDIGHFRAFCSMYLREPKLNILSILFGSSDKANRMRTDIPVSERDMRPGIKFGISGGQWEQHLDGPSDTTSVSADKYRAAAWSSSVGTDEVRFISAQYNADALIRFTPVLSLRDIDEAMFLPILNRSLAHKLRYIHVFANEYKLLEVSRDDFSIDESPFDPNVPVEFSPLELTDQWVRIRPIKSSAFRFSFSDETPQRTFSPRQTQNSLPMRGQE